MSFYVYILYSDSIKKYYTGQTSNISLRMEFHNSGKNNFTKKGTPWKIVKTFECIDRKHALILENKIKRNGAKRFLERNFTD